MTWSWPLFAWGVGVGIVGVAGSYAVGRIGGLRYGQPRAYLGLSLLSVAAGTAAAAIPSATVDVVFTAFVALANFAVPLMLLPRAARRAAPHACGTDATCSADACSTCPLGVQAKAKIKSA